MKNQRKKSFFIVSGLLLVGLLLLPRRSRSSVPTSQGSITPGSGQTGAVSQMMANLKPLEKYGKNVPKYWLAVAMFESGQLKNRLTMQANNPWAMTKVAQRPTTQIQGKTIQAENGNDFGVYGSLGDAAKDIVLYMDYFKSKYGGKKFDTLYSLLVAMKSSPFPYFSAPLSAYFAGVSAHYRKLYPDETDVS